MKISATGTKFDAFKVNFKSIRTDKNIVAQLKDGEKPIIENNKQNIYAALNNLSSQSDRESISFLLDVANNLVYGQSGNSKFKAALDCDGQTPSDRENTDWSKMLDDTIRKAISSSTEDIQDLELEYKKIFSSEKEMTPQQKRILELRGSFTDVILDSNVIEDSETLGRITNIRKNLDYFVASSEISVKQKEECLEKFITFMSDDYEINPQLSDKKLQIIDEMLNDMVIKTPDDSILKIKTVDQRQSGMCAAISICRKALAYEDKSRYVDLIMEELKDSPTMSVFDVTELDSGKKVDIPKTEVDYISALQKGYRIIDASAHNWMHNAHASGDGSLQTEYYVPFSDEHYGIFDDTSWYLGLGKEHSQEKALLAALIKEKEFLKSFYATKKQIESSQRNVSAVKKEVLESQKASIGKLNTIFSEIFPEKSNAELTPVLKSLIKFYSGSNSQNEVNVPQKLPLETKQDILVDYIVTSLDSVDEEQKSALKEKAPIIYSMVDEYSSADAKLTKLHRFNSPRSKYIYNKKLFNLAAAHRVAIEADVNMPDGVVRFERLSGLPPRDIQVVNYLSSLKQGLSSQTVRQKFSDNKDSVPTAKDMEKQLLQDIVMLETVIPEELDSITKVLYGKDITALTSDMYGALIQNIKAGDVQLLQNIKMMMSIKGDKNDVLDKLSKWQEKLNYSPSNKEVLEAIRLIGYEDRLQLANVLLSSFMTSLQQGISEEQYAELVSTFGGEDKVAFGIESINKKYANLVQEYSDITNKWQVPSARTQILNQMEKQHVVLSRRKLDKLKNRFDKIQEEMNKNEQILNMKDRNEANDKLYKFNKEELEIFDSIEKTMTSMKKYCKMEYQTLNDILFNELETQYANIGMLNGQFWVREEGSSGLAANEQIRIIEQMTGKPHHMETDALEAAKQIKQGKGSGILSLSVDDNDYAFHAQYVPSVTSERFVNPTTKEEIVRDIMWTDNSWGLAEKEHFWDGHNGHFYTDYARGFGWKDGFVLADDLRIGLPVDEIHGAIGYSPEDKEKFGLFTDVVLPGTPVKAYQKLYKMFNYILNVAEGQKFLSALESSIENGARLSVEELESLDSLAEAKTNRIAKRVEKGINSQEEFDKLPDNDEVKIAFNKLAVYLSTDNPMIADSVLGVETLSDLEEVKEEIFQEHLNAFGALVGKSDDTIDTLYEISAKDFDALYDALKSKYNVDLTDVQKKMIFDGVFFDEEAIKNHDGSLKSLEKYFINQIVDVATKTFDDEKTAIFFIEQAKQIILKNINENIRIKSLDDPILVNSPIKDAFINAIDKYLNPKSDSELLTLIQGLQVSDYDTVNGFFAVLNPEDVGLRTKSAYDYLKLYRAGDSAINKAFTEVVGTEEIYSNLNTSEDENATPEELYRNLYVKLAEMDVQKYIKAFKAEAFQKYKVRQAFPEPIVLPDDIIANTTTQMITAIKDHVDSIDSSQYVVDILTKYAEIEDEFFYSPTFMALLNKQNVTITEQNQEEFERFAEKVMELMQLCVKDQSFEMIPGTLNNLLILVGTAEGSIDGRTFGSNLKNLIATFKDLENSGVNIDRFVQLKKEEITSMNENISLMVNANVDPRFRDEVTNKIKKLIDVYRKTDSVQDVEILEDELLNLMVEKHIVKNPTLLLKECVKLLQNGQKESNQYEIMRTYLVEALKVAQQTKIQYKLVQNQHEAISSKTKDMLSLFSVKLTDGSTESMDSEMGMLYLVEQLKNTGDNYLTLNLFLEQSGLSKNALNALLNTFDLQKTNELVLEESAKAKDNLAKLDEIANIAEKFFASSLIRYKSLEDGVEQFKKYMKRKLKNHEDIVAYTHYLTFLDAVKPAEDVTNVTSGMIKPLLFEISRNALQYVAENINSQLSYIGDVAGMVGERAELICSINVPVNCDEYTARNKFLEEYTKTQNLIEQQNQEIIMATNNSKFLGTENRPC